MPSARIQRYILTQRAKGVTPDPMTLSKLIREDVSEGQPYVEKSAVTPAVTPAENQIRSVKTRRQNLLEQPTDDTGFDPGLTGEPSLASSLFAEAATPTLSKTGIKSGIKSALMTATAPKPSLSLATEAVARSMSAPVSLAIALNAMIGTGIASSLIGTNVEGQFGAQAAQEAAGVISGEVALGSISPKGQAAFANAKVAAQNAPKSLLGQLIGKIRGQQITKTPISTVTPFHTPEAISEAFGVGSFGEESAPHTNPNMVSTEAMLGMAAAGDPLGMGAPSGSFGPSIGEGDVGLGGDGLGGGLSGEPGGAGNIGGV